MRVCPDKFLQDGGSILSAADPGSDGASDLIQLQVHVRITQTLQKPVKPSDTGFGDIKNHQGRISALRMEPDTFPEERNRT